MCCEVFKYRAYGLITSAIASASAKNINNNKNMHYTKVNVLYIIHVFIHAGLCNNSTIVCA